jgi:drug/metabolite transporter (DMT)-like permease
VTPHPGWRGAALTSLALLAFAGNSLLCRLALSRGVIDPASFTTIRLAAGALALALLLRWRAAPATTASWPSAGLLALYAVPFAFAYVTLSTGTGALLLFGAVQVTMLVDTLRRGDRHAPAQWLGAGRALGGLVYLLLPGLTAPPLVGALLMLLAGVAWGLYTLRGRNAADPLGDTAANFLRAAPFALLASGLTVSRFHLEAPGFVLAVASGAIASGLGYVIWYAALQSLTSLTASSVQLSVPVLAAIGGVVFLGERVSLRLLVAAVLVLGGIGLAMKRPSLSTPDSSRPAEP